MGVQGFDKFIQSLGFTFPLIQGQTLEVDSNLNFVNVSARSAKTSIDDGDSPYTSLLTDSVIIADSSSGAVTVALSDAGTTPKGFRLRVIASSGTNDVTVAKSGTDTLTTFNSRDVLQEAGEWIEVVCDGVSNWTVIGFGTISAEA